MLLIVIQQNSVESGGKKCLNHGELYPKAGFRLQGVCANGARAVIACYWLVFVCSNALQTYFGSFQLICICFTFAAILCKRFQPISGLHLNCAIWAMLRFRLQQYPANEFHVISGDKDIIYVCSNALQTFFGSFQLICICFTFAAIPCKHKLSHSRLQKAHFT
jgi:hypothetical protein